MAEIWLTPDEMKKRQERLEYLKVGRRDEIAEMLKEARAQGDLSENAEYDAAKDLQAKNEYDIVQLENELKNAKIIDEAQLKADVVNVGSTVTIMMKANGMQMKYKIVGSAETDPTNGLISNESPIGKAILGHKKGETVEVITPGGAMELLIKEIGF